MSSSILDDIPLDEADELGLVASICRSDFSFFVQEFWEAIPGTDPLIWNWHMQYLCDELQQVAERVFNGVPREHDIVCNISPGTSKSSIASILFPAWIWTRMPRARIMTASHTDRLALDLATKSRVVIKSEKYSGMFGEIRLRLDQDTKGYFSNIHGGDRFTCTVSGSSPMGFHAHFIIVDDPINPKEAVSDLMLENARNFFDRELPTRKTDKEVTVTFLIMQRLHEADPTGHLLKKAKKDGGAPVKHICLPAELPKGDDGAYLPSNVNPPELVKRYINGLMDPVRLSRKVLNEYKVGGEVSYPGQFLQNPTPIGGGLFKRSYFNLRQKAAPRDARRVRYWDRASTAGGGCRTAGVLVARDSSNRYYIEHVVAGQWEPHERNETILATALRDRQRYGPDHEPVIWVEGEGGSSGKDSFLYLVRKLQGFIVREHNVSRAGNKEVRAEPFSCQCAAGNVVLISDGTWDIEMYLDELCKFPLGIFKDQTDASSGAFAKLAQGGSRQAPRVYTLGHRKGGLHLVVCSREELSGITLEGHRGIHIGVGDPGTGAPVLGPNSFAIDELLLSFGNLDPKDHQETWDDVIPAYGVPAREVIMTRDDGKKLWAFLSRNQKRDKAPDVWVFQDEGEGDRRAISLAYAVCDSLRLKRKEAVHILNKPDESHEGNAPNEYIYNIVRATRDLVM